MTEKEIGQLLVIIQSVFPNYEPSKKAVEVWRRVLGDKLTYEQAEQYLYEHLGESRFIPVPADLLKRRSTRPDLITLDEKEREFIAGIHRSQRESNTAT